MTLFSPSKKARAVSQEKKSAKILIEKMGLPRKELEQISEIYGVSAAQLLEVMQYSKYHFVYDEPPASQCQPCKSAIGKFNALSFLRKGA